MTKIKCIHCGMVLEAEDYSIPLERQRKGMYRSPCLECSDCEDEAYKYWEPEEDDNNKNNTRIC